MKSWNSLCVWNLDQAQQSSCTPIPVPKFSSLLRGPSGSNGIRLRTHDSKHYQICAILRGHIFIQESYDQWFMHHPLARRPLHLPTNPNQIGDCRHFYFLFLFSFRLKFFQSFQYQRSCKSGQSFLSTNWCS